MTQALVPTADHPAQRLLDAFLGGRNLRTLAAYRADLSDFAAFTGVQDAGAAAEWLLAQVHGDANAAVLAWRSAMVERGLAAATINRRLAAVRSFVKLGRTLGMVPWALEVDGVDAQPYRDTRGPGPAGVRAMLVAVGARKDAKAVRDVAVLRLLHDMALRRGEVVALDREHLDLDAGKLAVLGKGRRARELLTVPAPTLGALRNWIAVRGDARGPLFTSFDRAGKGDGRMSGAGVFIVVRGAGRAAGLDAWPHGLRHAAITAALDVTGGDVRKVQRFSRHRDVRTLAIYDDNRRDMGGEVAALVAVA